MSTTEQTVRILPEGADYIGFGAAEVAYLLSRQTGPAIDKAWELLSLQPELTGQEVRAAGASSLLARGLLAVVGDRLELDGAATALLYGFAAAERWTQIGFLSDETADGAILVQAPELSLLLQPRQLGTWYVLFQNPEVAAAEALRVIVDAHLDRAADAAVFLGSETLEASSTLYLRRALGAYRVAQGADITDEQIPVRPATRDEVDALLAELVTTTA